VLSGNSAGGTLALTTGMITNWPGLDNRCPTDQPVKVAAIVNWFGVYDLSDVLDGPNKKPYAIGWFNAADLPAAAVTVSPRHYVRATNPPIISIHGDADPTVPYEHSVALHRALAQAGVAQSLVTVAGGRHGGFTSDQNRAAFSAIRTFLSARGITSGSRN
jgi:acetyl esterase/lipase